MRYVNILIIGLFAIVPMLAVADDPITSESDDSPSNANRFSASGRDFKESLYSASDLDFFKLTTKVAGNLTLKLGQKSPGVDPNLAWQVDIYSEVDLANSFYSARLQETSLSTEFEIGLSAGTFYIKVSSANPEFAPLGGYTLTGYFEESDYFEKTPNYSPELATSIVPGQLYSGNLPSSVTADYFRFSLTTEDIITLSLSQTTPGLNPNVGWILSLYSQETLNAPLQEVILPETIKSAALSASLPAGVYYVRVGSLNGNTTSAGRYQLQVALTNTVVDTGSCAQVLAYAQSPMTNDWVVFPSPCDVPPGWFTTLSMPADIGDLSTLTNPEHASVTPISADGTTFLLKVPAVDVPNAQGSVDVFSTEIQIQVLDPTIPTLKLDLISLEPVIAQ
jgi:hypothetical protein